LISHLWTESFLAALAASGNVSDAARRSHVDRGTVYERRDKDPEFKAAWNEALEAATEALELEARRRAHDGTVKPVFYKGSRCDGDHVREYSDALMMFLLRSLKPLKYRENVKHEHEGDLTIRVEYASPDYPIEPSDPVASEGLA